MTDGSRKRKSINLPLKILLIISGIFFTTLGIIGIFLPILPTTPFLILAAACFLRSSDRLYHWLLSNRVFGKYLRNYLEKKGIPLGVKIFTISLLWFTILLSVFMFVEIIWIDILLIIIAVGVSLHLLLIKTYKEPEMK